MRTVQRVTKTKRKTNVNAGKKTGTKSTRTKKTRLQ